MRAHPKLTHLHPCPQADLDGRGGGQKRPELHRHAVHLGPVPQRAHGLVVDAARVLSERVRKGCERRERFQGLGLGGSPRDVASW